MFRSIFLLMCSAGWALVSSVAGSAMLFQEEYGRIISYSSYVTFISIFLLLGMPGYALAHLDRFVKDESFYLRLPIVATIGAIFCSILFDQSLVLIAYSALSFLTVVSSQRALTAQVQQHQLLCTFYQAVPSFVKSFALSFVLLTHICLPRYVEKGELFILFNLLLLVISIGLSWYIFPRNLTSLVDAKSETTRNKLRRIYFEESGFAFWLSPVLALGYSVAVAPIVAYKYGFALAAYVGIYLIFWSINSIFLTAVFNNYFSSRFAHARNIGYGLSSVVRPIFVFSLFIGVASVLIGYAGAFVGSATIWSHYDKLESFLFVCTLGFLLRSFSAALGILASFPPLIKLKTFVQLIALALVLIQVQFVSEMTVKGLALLLLEVEVVILTGYALIVCGARLRDINWYGKTAEGRE